MRHDSNLEAENVAPKALALAEVEHLKLRDKWSKAAGGQFIRGLSHGSAASDRILG
jgi:hypothetical protein